MNSYEEILSTILECDEEELATLNNIGYDILDIVEDCKYNDCLSLNGILEGVVLTGKRELENALEVAMFDDFKNISNSEINVDEDFNYEINGSETWVSLDNLNIYVKFLQCEINEIETNMGFVFK